MPPQEPNEGEPEKLDLRSADPAEAKRRELLRLFPEVRTEGGKIDVDRLRRALGETVDPGKERYGLTWPGKADCFRTIQASSLATLRPSPEESVDFDSTENLIIEGDNLEVLKLLQKPYLGKIKMIYIDPPYNTGNDFIYPDNYAESLQTYLEYTGQVDAQGKKFSTNTETDGRFHSKWLNMMYPRLYLARNLLREDGVMCVSIDDREAPGLRMLMNELFGDESHLATVVWQKKDTPSNDATGFSITHEYVMLYQESEEFTRNLLPRSDTQLENYKNPDSDLRGPWTRTSLIRKEVREERLFAVRNPRGRERTPPKGTSWRISQESFAEYEADGRLWWGKDEDGDLPFLKRFLSDVKDGVVPISWWDYEFAGSNRNAKVAIRDIFDGDVPFETPKPSLLVKRLLQISTSAFDRNLVLDFFAGSGTTGDAVLDLNNEDSGNRRYILVQLPEPTGRTDYPTVAKITTDRLRRVARKLGEPAEGSASQLALPPPAVSLKPDRGFRVFKLAESNFMPWNAEVPPDPAALARQLELHVDHLRPGRSPQDILYEILLKSGFPLATPTETITLAGKTVSSVAAGALLVCLERPMTLELVRAMADRRPERIVCLDEGFAGNDQLKVNAVHIFRTKGVASFKTV